MKKLTLITSCAFFLITVSGCLMFYTGSEEGPFKVVAVCLIRPGSSSLA